MQKFLLIVGIMLILMGLVVALLTLLVIEMFSFHGPFRGGPPPGIILYATVFFAVLYITGFGTLYLRRRIAEPSEGA